MNVAERNSIKAKYLECQNKELTVKNSLEQKLHAIAVEEERKEKDRIAALNKKTEEERIAAEPSFAKASEDEQEHSPIEQPVVAQPVTEASCCICFEEDLQLLKKIPCKNIHSDHICGACLQAPSVKTCPICRGPLTK